MKTKTRIALCLLRNGDVVLAALVLAAVLAIFAMAGCTPDEVASVQSDARQAALGVQAVIVAYESHEATVDQVVNAAAAASPKIGGQVLQAATLLKQNTATLDMVKSVAAGAADALKAPAP